MVRAQEPAIHEVGQGHEGTAVADLLDHFGRQLVDLIIRQLAEVVPDPARAGGWLEGARKPRQHGAAGQRAVRQGLAAHAREHGFPGLLGGRVDVEAAVVERIPREVSRVGKLVEAREGPVGDRGLVVRLEGDPLVGEGVIAGLERGLDVAEGRGVEGTQIARRFFQRRGLIGRDVRVGRQVGPSRESVLASGERVGVGLEVQPAEVVGVPQCQVGGERVVGAHVGDVADDARPLVDGDVAVFGDGLVGAGLLLGARPVGDLGQILDAGMGERGADREVGIGVNLRETGGA